MKRSRQYFERVPKTSLVGVFFSLRNFNEYIYIIQNRRILYKGELQYHNTFLKLYFAKSTYNVGIRCSFHIWVPSATKIWYDLIFWLFFYIFSFILKIVLWYDKILLYISSVILGIDHFYSYGIGMQSQLLIFVCHQIEYGTEREKFPLQLVKGNFG